MDIITIIVLMFILSLFIVWLVNRRYGSSTSNDSIDREISEEFEHMLM